MMVMVRPVIISNNNKWKMTLKIWKIGLNIKKKIYHKSMKLE